MNNRPTGGYLGIPSFHPAHNRHQGTESAVSQDIKGHPTSPFLNEPLLTKDRVLPPKGQKPPKSGAEGLSCLIYQRIAPSTLVARASPVARMRVRRIVTIALFEPISLQRTAIAARHGM